MWQRSDTPFLVPTQKERLYGKLGGEDFWKAADSSFFCLFVRLFLPLGLWGVFGHQDSPFMPFVFRNWSTSLKKPGWFGMVGTFTSGRKKTTARNPVWNLRDLSRAAKASWVCILMSCYPPRGPSWLGNPAEIRIWKERAKQYQSKASCYYHFWDITQSQTNDTQ